jgi:hypothetical protein
MALERRGNRTYYYRKRRVGRRVVSEYAGSGEEAVLGERLDRCGRMAAEWQRQCGREELANTAAGEQPTRDLSVLVSGLTKLALVEAGCHTHKGTWRRRRNV